MPATTANETITVDKAVQGKYGPQVKVGDKYYSFGKFYKGDALEAGRTYEVEVYTSDKGYKSVNRVIADITKPTPAPAGEKVGEKKAPAKRSPLEAALSAEADRSARILVQGVYQAYASNPALLNLAQDSDAVAKLVAELTLQGVTFILNTVKGM
jgi:hypothetical protein